MRVAAARTRGDILDGAVFPSDDGARYASKEFATVPGRFGVIRLLGAVGASADNAALLHVAEAEREAVAEPEGVRDHLRREPESPVLRDAGSSRRR